MEFFNLELVKHPINWITVFLMVFLFMWALALVTGHYTNLKQGNHLI